MSLGITRIGLSTSPRSDYYWGAVVVHTGVISDSISLSDEVTYVNPVPFVTLGNLLLETPKAKVDATQFPLNENVITVDIKLSTPKSTIGLRNDYRRMDN